MVMITGNKCLVHASVSVLAMILSASMALADDDQTSAGIEGEPVSAEMEIIEPQITECELGYVPEVTGVDTKGEEFIAPEGLIYVDGETTETGMEAEVLPVIYNTESEGVDPMLIRATGLSTKDVEVRESVAHDPASVPNLCDVAGPGLNWLCGAQTR